MQRTVKNASISSISKNWKTTLFFSL